MRPGKVDERYQVQETLDLLPLFDVFVETYKTVNGHPIGLHVLVPKDNTAGKRPVLVKLHGGGWHEGASDYYFRPWTLELALRHNAVVVSPDHRLLPECQLTDVIDDLRDFWTWVDESLETLPGMNLDAANLAIVGESAGGHLTAQSVLLGFSKRAAAVLMQYPAVALKDGFDMIKQSPACRNAPVSILDEYLARVDPSTLLTRAENGTRMDLFYASVASDRLVDLAKHPHLDPITSLETAERIPPVFLFHGVDDSSAPVECSQSWVKKLEELHPSVPVHAIYPPGEHVLDEYTRLEDAWLHEPIAFVERYWPVK